MLESLLYHVRVLTLSRSKVEITYVPNWLGRLLKRRVRQGTAYRARSPGRYGEVHWWWRATDRWVGDYVERYIEATPLLALEDMTVEQLLLEAPPKTRRKS